MPSSSSSPTATAGPRYAPPDPCLPKPWRELIDGATGNHYFWNPETGVTQYNRPRAALPPPPPGPPPPRKRARDDDRRPPERQAYEGETGDAEGGASAAAYRRKHEIVVTGDDVPAPFTTFESTDFPAEMLREVHHAGFSVPTPIQAQSWPIAMRSRDIVAVAKTGSGKTLGYLFPGFVHLKKLRNNNRTGPTVLVLAPTRELATQIQDEAEKFGRSSRISCTCLYGGAAKGPQLRDISKGVDVVVATPGRLNDIIEMRRISLHQVSYLVLDEADRMLDMGFEPQIRKIVKEIPHRRQTLMFTATWPKEVRRIAADLLVNPIQVNIGGTDMLVANKAITQHVEVTTPNEKQRRLEQILYSQDPGSKVLIFCSTKRMCDQLSWALDRKFGAVAIHGDKSQAERDRVLGRFRSGKSPILVATDVASRGLDIKDIRVVINYDFPTDIEDYVHRIGRTGRAGATGVSYTFFCKKDSNYAPDLIKVLEGANQYVPPELEDMVRRGGSGRRSRGKARRWRSSPSAHDRRRSRGGRRDSIYGGRGGLDMPSSGRSYGSRDIREASDDEYSYRSRGLDLGIRNHHDTKNTWVTGVRSTGRHSRSSTVSLSPKRRRIGRSDSRCSSHSMSRSPSRGRIRSIGRSRSISRSISRSRSRSRSISHSRSRGRSISRSKSFSDSRSRSISQGVGRAAASVRTPSPISKREPSTDHISDPVHSPTTYFDQQQKLAQAEQHDCLPSPLKGNSHSPSGRGINPYQHGNDDDAEKAGKLYVEKVPPGPYIDAEAGMLQVEKPPSCPIAVAEAAGNLPVGKLRPCSNNGKDEEENGTIPEDQI